MAQTRTAKGTAANKTSSTTLAITGVSCDAGTLLLVAVAWEDGGQTDKPDLTWGNKDMKYVLASESIRGDTVLRWYRFKVKKDVTKDITATWTNAKLAKCMFAVQLAEASIKDVQSINNQPAVTLRGTGAAVTTTEANTLHIAAFTMIGPTTDATGTAGLGHTLGQKTGTSGGGPLTNITLQETYESLTAGSPLGDCRATLTLVTARAGGASIVAWAPSQTYTVNRAYYQPWDANPDQESVVFVMEDETNEEIFQVLLPRREFEELSDTDVEDYIRNRCLWRADKDFDDAPSPDFTPDATFNSRVSSFVNDSFTV